MYLLVIEVNILPDWVTSCLLEDLHSDTCKPDQSTDVSNMVLLKYQRILMRLADVPGNYDNKC